MTFSKFIGYGIIIFLVGQFGYFYFTFFVALILAGLY